MLDIFLAVALVTLLTAVTAVIGSASVKLSDVID